LTVVAYSYPMIIGSYVKLGHSDGDLGFPISTKTQNW